MKADRGRKIKKRAASPSKARARKGKEQKDRVTWVQCDGCRKWRKLKKHAQLDVSKSFKCQHLGGLTCKTKQESID